MFDDFELGRCRDSPLLRELLDRLLDSPPLLRGEEGRGRSTRSLRGLSLRSRAGRAVERSDGVTRMVPPMRSITRRGVSSDVSRRGATVSSPPRSRRIVVPEESLSRGTDRHDWSEPLDGRRRIESRLSGASSGAVTSGSTSRRIRGAARQESPSSLRPRLMVPPSLVRGCAGVASRPPRPIAPSAGWGCVAPRRIVPPLGAGEVGLRRITPLSAAAPPAVSPRDPITPEAGALPAAAAGRVRAIRSRTALGNSGSRRMNDVRSAVDDPELPLPVPPPKPPRAITPTADSGFFNCSRVNRAGAPERNASSPSRDNLLRIMSVVNAARSARVETILFASTNVHPRRSASPSLTRPLKPIAMSTPERA